MRTAGTAAAPTAAPSLSPLGRSRQMVVVLVGNIGSGKSTWCERLLGERATAAKRWSKGETRSGGGDNTNSSSSSSNTGEGEGSTADAGANNDGNSEHDSPRFEVVSQDLLGSKDKVRREG